MLFMLIRHEMILDTLDDTGTQFYMLIHIFCNDKKSNHCSIGIRGRYFLLIINVIVSFVVIINDRDDVILDMLWTAC